VDETNDHLFSVLFSDKILEFIILPTEQCNFRCVYCYEDFIDGRMKRETIDSIKALIKTRASGLEHLRIGWFGGEPLLVKDIIIDISSHAMSLVRSNPGLFFDSGMSTNGYLLTHNTAEQLILHGVTEFQVSLDGPASYHDNVRLRRDGKGTFDRIWKNLLNLKNSSLEFKVNIRVHFSKDNINVIGILIEALKETFSNDDRFRVFFKSIVPLGGKNDASLNCFSDEEAHKVIQEFQSHLGSHVSILTDEESPYICYAGRPTSFVIRHDGSLAKCTVGLDEPENRIGYLRPNGILEIDQAKIQPWFKGAVSMDRKVLRCPKAFL
jgi:uncharacterized protein